MCGVEFLNPFLLSSSPVSNTAEMIGRAFDYGFSGVAYKTIVDDRTKIIHPAPRMSEYVYGSQKLTGLQNIEQTSDRSLVDNFKDIAYLKRNWPKHIVIVSIMGFKLSEWIELAKRSQDAGADMLELNFSCPHMTVEGAGMKVGQAFELVEKFTEAVKNVVSIPVLAKLTSNVTDITQPALFAKNGGADGITAINTVAGLTEVGLDDFVPRPNVNGKGAISGFSGPAIKPIGLRCVSQLSQCSDLVLPISGCGGIETWVDVAEYLLCGSSTIQITTGVIHYGQRIVEDMAEGLMDFMDSKGFNKVSVIIGKANANTHPTDAFDLGYQGIADFNMDKCVGCGQCHIVCQDAGGQALGWNTEERIPVPDDDKCVSCMICSFVCPVDNPPMITFKEVKNKAEVIPPVSV